MDSQYSMKATEIDSGITRYYVGGQEVSAFEMTSLTHMAETKTTLDAILKELRKLNKSLKTSPK